MGMTMDLVMMYEEQMSMKLERDVTRLGWKSV